MQLSSPPPSTVPDLQPRSRAASVWQAGLSLLGSGVLLIVALVYARRGLSLISTSVSRQAITGSFLLAASLAFCGVLLLPSAVYALARLVRVSPQDSSMRRKLKPLTTILPLGIAFTLLLVIGELISELFPLAWIVLPFIHILVIAIPVVGVLYLGAGGLPMGSQQRKWGIFAAGMTLGPLLAFTLEIAALFICLIAGILAIAIFFPDQFAEFSHLAEQLQTIDRSTDELLPVLQPYLKNPIVSFGALLFMAGIAPVLEEAIKPVGVWMLAKRHLPPVEGFTAGLLSGAGFALVESLGYTSDGGQGWLSAVLLRAPTAVMHILTCGLTGWGLAKAVSQHRLRWLLAGYGGAVAIHGMWNGLTLSAAGIALLYPDQPGAVALAGLAMLGLLVLFGFVFLLLIVINRHLWRQSARAIIPPQTVLGSVPAPILSESESSLHESHP